MTFVAECLKEFYAIRKKFRGQPNEIRPRYWQLTESMMLRFKRLSVEERKGFFNTLTKDETILLFGIARGAATESVIEQNDKRLYWGLLALVMENQTRDYRESLIELTLLDHSAKKIGTQLEAVFEQVKGFASEKTIKLFETYFREGIRDASAMGYVESLDKDGEFTYKQSW